MKVGQYLPHFIDWMERGAEVPPVLKAPWRDVVAHMKRANRSGVCFALADDMWVETRYPRTMTGAELRPPYPITIIEYDASGVDGGVYDNVIIAEDFGTYVKLRPYAMIDQLGLMVSVCPFEATAHYNEQLAVFDTSCWSQALVTEKLSRHPDKKEMLAEATQGILETAIATYANLCATLGNNYVEMTDVAPDAKQNRIRRIKGQAPLYTYKTLVIGPEKPRKTGRGGGTHASPRSHLRRGFYRTSKSGNRHWVNATMVMGETSGFVHKDYKVEQGENQ